MRGRVLVEQQLAAGGFESAFRNLLHAYRRFESDEVPGAVIEVNDGVPIKAWTKGVKLEDEARKQLLNVAQLPIVHQWVAAMPDADAFDRSLQQTLLSLLPEGGATVARVAEALHVSVRTLQRRLDSRGLTWQQVLDRSREELARHYLADRALTLSDIALLLGFSEQSAFTRAFRRWTGETPVQIRKRLRTTA